MKSWLAPLAVLVSCAACVVQTSGQCVSNGDCAGGAICEDGVCKVKGCAAAGDCTTPPDGCHLAEGAQCQGGVCSYPEVQCAQVAPFDYCRALTGSCNPTRDVGTCRGTGCCEFRPLYPAGTAGDPPLCPFAGEDADGDGVRDNGESWTGVCTNSSECVGCVAPAQCDDQNECSLEDCVAEACDRDVTTLVGTTCTHFTASDGLCVTVGEGIGCLLATGQDCMSDAACASGQCECADAACARSICTQDDCLCQYVEEGACTGVLDDGAKEPGECDGALSCYAGACKLDPGRACAADLQCATGECECINAGCSIRVCASASCTCRYGIAGACSTALDSGSDDPEDCDGPSSCYAGACLSDLGEECAANTQCATGQCECADALCATRVCAAASCTCKYSASGGCATNLSNGVPDPEDCDGASVCNSSGLCVPDTGTPCTSHAQCGAGGHCECVDASCTSRKCASSACLCGWGSSTAPCTTKLAANIKDVGDCDGSSACFNGLCKPANGQACTANSQCGSGQCECADATCTTKVCAAASCLCKYGTAGACTTNLTAGTADPQDCDGSSACFSGVCGRANGQSCAANNQCGSGQCECADATCSSRVCAATSCLCKYGTSCGTNLNANTADPQDCDGSSACFSGACGKANGQACTANAGCGSGNCECTNAGCTARVCAAADCDCKYGSAGACTSNLDANTADPQDCDGSSACFSGVCGRANGQSCTANNQCGSGNCECADAACAARVCAAANCLCKYGTTCSTNLSANTADPQDCDGSSACFSGACGGANGQSCTANSQCGSGQCECADSACSSRVCAAASCLCKYGAAGACTGGNLGSGAIDPEDCDGASVCNGSGVCGAAGGQTCTSNASCGSGHCECANATCSVRYCAAANCICKYGASGACTAGQNLTDSYADPQDCDGSSACFAGVCGKANGQSCTSNAGCGSGHCECTNATCTTRVCAAADCDCRYGSGGACTAGQNLTDGYSDPQDCDGGNACFAGVCGVANGQACTANSGCGSGHCECANATCSARVCAAADCDCKYSATGGCTTNLSNGATDFGDCDGTNACFGGVCGVANGQGCTTNSGCGSGQCECTNATCSTRVCAALDCDCKYGTNGACTTNLNTGYADVGDCDGTNACSAAGTCLKANAQSCTANSQCASAQCECSNAGCTTRVCAANSCTCKYSSTGGCSYALNSGIDDPEDCTQSGTSCWGGVCAGDNLSLGSICYANGECQSNSCQCASADCGVRRCANLSCICKYVSSAGTSCSGNISNNVQQPNVCYGTSGCLLAPGNYCACNGSGACTQHSSCIDCGKN